MLYLFSNQAGLDMLETTFVVFQDIMLDKLLDEVGSKILCSEFAKFMWQVKFPPPEARARLLIDPNQNSSLQF